MINPGRWAVLAAAALGVVVALSACALPRKAGLSDIQLTWAEAVVALPAAPGDGVGKGQIVRGMAEALRRMEDGTAGRSLPVVLYLHGCTGIHDLAVLERLAGEGFVVIAPNSMARRYRPLQCDPESRAGGFNLFVYDFRLAEIAFALKQLKALQSAVERELRGISPKMIEGTLVENRVRCGNPSCRCRRRWLRAREWNWHCR